MNILLLVLAGIAGATAVWQLAVWIFETRDKKQKYRDALTGAEKSGKPMLVVGGPWGALPFRYALKIPAHGGGDVCLDIDARAFRGHPCGILADVKEMPFRNGSFGAVFISHVLEHLDTAGGAAAALRELTRVSDAVFVVSPSRQSIAAWIKREHHLWIWQEGNVICVTERGNGFRGVLRCPLRVTK